MLRRLNAPKTNCIRYWFIDTKFEAYVYRYIRYSSPKPKLRGFRLAYGPTKRQEKQLKREASENDPEYHPKPYAQVEQAVLLAITTAPLNANPFSTDHCLHEETTLTLCYDNVPNAFSI